MRILVGTPTYNGQLTTQYTGSLLALRSELGDQVDWKTTSGTLLAWARNTLASLVLESDHSHLLFIDSDIDYPPSLIRRMIDFDAPMVAAVYPHRVLDVQRFHAMARAHDDPAAAWARSLSFVMELETPPVERNGFYRARYAGTGLMLIKREVFETLRDTCPDLYRPAAGSYYGHQGLKHVLQCFEPQYDEAGLAMSEDVSFCRRWQQAGGELWVVFDDTVGHVGPFTFRARA
ncbi:hypothetical protein [Phenylobacterium sp.]|jgi:hypothetical protein|uniref:hypothetical protein n=1 Tax=Phenylobacterium sp. TaxID=1871053 RepID=UPI002F9215F1